MKSRVQIPSTRAVATHPVTSVLWEMAAKGSLELVSLALAQREIPSQRNELASDTAGPRHPTPTSRIHRPMQAQMSNYTMYTTFSILNLLSSLMSYELKKKRCWEIHSHSENFDSFKAIVPYWILCFL